jgi:2-desacetyl-2-hydroxyethyl bacteriochlorophyllide A dehydrogenase
MQTLELKEPGLFHHIKKSEPQLKSPTDVIVRIKSIGICGTDIHAYHGRQPFFNYPRILGHELGVEVVKTGSSVTKVAVGDKCSVEPYLNCGICHPCRKGKSNCCEKLQVLGVHTDGGMTELFCIPEHKLHRSDRLNFDQLALVETLGIGCHAVARAQMNSEDKVLVIGAGPIGLTAIEFAKAEGAEVDVFDLNTHRISVCKELGKGDNHLSVSPPENTYDVVFDATGNPQSMAEAMKYVAHGGKLVFIGLYQGDYTFNDPYFHKKEMTLLSSRNALSGDFTKIISLLESGKLDVDYMISEKIKFDNVPEFFANLNTKTGLIKGIITL